MKAASSLAFCALLAATVPACAAQGGGFLQWGQRAPAEAPGPGQLEAKAFATALTAALSSGEWERVAPFFPRADLGAAAFVKARWTELRQRKLDVQQWDVSFRPYFASPARLDGRLAIRAKGPRGTGPAAQWDVELVHRGSGWVLDDELMTAAIETHVLAHDLVLDLRQPGRLAGTDTLMLAPSGPDRRVFLTLAPGLAVQGASVNGQPWPVTQHDELVAFERPESMEPVAVTLRYGGQIERKLPLRLEAQAPWYPRPLLPGFASYRLAVTASPGIELASSGEPAQREEKGNGWTSRFVTRSPIAGEDLLAGRFKRVAGLAVSKSSQVSLAALLAPGTDTALGKGLMGEAAAVMGFFSAHYGQYPYPDLSFVQLNGTPPGVTTVPLSDAELASFETARDAVARGAARAWIATARYEGSPAEQRLMTEGVSAYMALLYRAERDGPKGFRLGLAEAQAEVNPRVVIDGPATPDAGASDAGAIAFHLAPPDPARRAIARDLFIMHTLRRKVGNAAFDRGFQALYGQPLAPAITLARFRQAFEQPSKQHLEGFFQQWLEREEIPGFTLDAVAVTAAAKAGGPAKDDRYFVTGTLVQSDPAFALKVPVVIRTAARPILFEVPVQALRTPFRLVVHAAPREVLVDPLHDTPAPPLPPLQLAEPS